jgi:TRAP-type mannitol/chloroaromatic compound transport system permease large subunit
MAVAALITCALFATATGIVGAVVTLMGLLALPAMLKARYDTSFASGVICAGGTLGILIPPSIMLIVYAAASGVSIVQLYAGALLPGLLLAGLYLVYVVGRAIAAAVDSARADVDEEVPDRPLRRLVMMLADVVLPAGLPDPGGAGRDPVRPGDADRGSGGGALGGLVLAVGLPGPDLAALRKRST